MKYYGTKDNKHYGFYEKNFEGAIEISDEYWMSLLSAQSDSKIIIKYNDQVLAVDPLQYTQQDGIWVKLSEQEAKNKQLTIQNEIRANEIKSQLDELDAKRIRAIAEPSLKDEDTTWLEFYNSQAAVLRTELAKLS